MGTGKFNAGGNPFLGHPLVLVGCEMSKFSLKFSLSNLSFSSFISGGD